MADFEVRTFRQLVTDALDYIRANSTKLKDFSAGSRLRTLVEAVSRLVSDLYLAAQQGIKRAVESAMFDGFDFPARPASCATGYVVFGRSTAAVQDYVIPVGAVISRSDPSGEEVYYVTTAQAVLSTGQTQTVPVPIVAQREGVIGNCLEDTVTTLKTQPSGIETVTNPLPIVSGTEAETLAERKERFALYIESLPRATCAALEYAALQVATVVGAKAVDSPLATVLRYDASLTEYTDVSTEANEPFGSQFGAFPAVEAVGDCLYIGAERKFDRLYINLQQAGVLSGDGVWEYHNGSDWTALTVTDGTTQLTATGVVAYTAPSDWQGVKADNVWLFWVRFRLTSGSYSTDPMVYHVMLPPPPGWVELYVHDASGAADSTLLATVKTAVEPYRGSGTRINVKSPTLLTPTLTVSIRVAEGFDKMSVVTEVRNAITDYVNSLALGEPLVLPFIVQRAFAIQDGTAVLACNVTAPAADLLVASGELVRAGTVTVNLEN